MTTTFVVTHGALANTAALLDDTRYSHWRACALCAG
jgi:hypothetical protein